MINYLLPLIFFLVVLIDSGVNAYLIEKKNRKINHKVEGLIYLLICLAISVPLKIFFHVHWGWLISFAILTRAAFFSPLLNLFRGLKLNYMGDTNKPVNEQSWFDRMELQLNISPSVFIFLFAAMYILNLIIFEL